MIGRSYPATELRLVASPKLSPEADYTIGRAVRLQSGGPDMLVVDRSPGRATVSWQANGTVREAELPIACLQIIETSAGEPSV